MKKRHLKKKIFVALVLIGAVGPTVADESSSNAPTAQPADARTSPPAAILRTNAAGKELQPYQVKVNDKEYDFIQLLKLRPADTNGAQIATIVPFHFIHPGTLSNLEELEFIKQRINEGKEPWASAFLRLKKSRFAGLDYLQKMKTPPAVISSGFSGAHAIGAFEEMNDANAAYAQALMWYFTGDKTYAQNGEAILEKYAATVTSHQGLNWFLLVAWSGAIFPVAADLLHATDPEWKNDRVVAKWFNDVFLPVLHDRVAFGNREFAGVNAMAAIGVYNEDPAAFYEAINHWINYLPAYYYLTADGTAPALPDYWTPEVTPSDEFLTALDASTLPKDWTSWIQLAQENYSPQKIHGKLGDDTTGMRGAVTKKDSGVVWTGAPGTYRNGYTAENARDLGHVEVSLVSTINTAEIAWHQGIDLYSPAAKRLTTFMEAETALRLGEAPPSSVTTPLKALGTGPGAFELAYDHFHNLLGIGLPNTQKYLETVLRPANGARVYPVAKGDAGHDPDNPRLWKYPPPFPPLFASVISEEDGWLSSFQTLTHRDLNAH